MCPEFELISAGMTFGAWTVLSVDSAGKRATCRCACGTVRKIGAEALQGSATTSCGCRRPTPGQARARQIETAARRRRQERDWRPGF